MRNNYDRFSQKVQDYIRYRPEYPKNMFSILAENIQLTADAVIADVGSGTGLSSMPFLDKNLLVYAVEPNKDMRNAAETIFKDNSNFISINGTSEKTLLKENSIDLIFCGQAFHWFDLPKTKIEFKRILKPEGKIVLAWNERNTESPLQDEYEKILYENIEEYKFVNHKNIDEQIIADFFHPKVTERFELENSQHFDLKRLKGRACSSSYMPKNGEVFDAIMSELEHLYKKYQENGLVEFKYKTKIYFCNGQI